MPFVAGLASPDFSARGAWSARSRSIGRAIISDCAGGGNAGTISDVIPSVFPATATPVPKPSFRPQKHQQNQSQKSGLKPGRAWRIVAGPDVPEINLRIPLDPETVARLRRTHVDYFEAAGREALIKPDIPPINIVGGYRFPNAPVIHFNTEVAMAPITPATVAGDGLDILDFLKRSEVVA
jgi:hypothetical protein